MLFSKSLSAFFITALITAATGCAAQHDDTASSASADVVSSSRNEDVQVLKVYAGPSFGMSTSSIYNGIKQEDCKPEGTTWDAIKAHDNATQGSMSVTLDCTEAVVAKYGMPVMRAVKSTGYRSNPEYVSSYGYVGFSNSGGSYWSKTVELVVKQSAIDAPSFNGIGYYLNSFYYRYYEQRPAPGPNNGNGYFQTAEQVRAAANAYPATTLASGEQARVIKVLLPAEWQSGGTSSVPAFYFRPFAEYGLGADKSQRWDSVAQDYFISVRTPDFNREADILRH